jgi:predicted secreted protein
MKSIVMLFIGLLLSSSVVANTKEDVVFVDEQSHEAVFTLPENPSTGYRWFVLDLPEGVEALDYHYDAPSANLPGKPGTGTSTFTLSSKATKVPRIFEVKMKLARAWEPAEAGQEKTLWVITNA